MSETKASDEKKLANTYAKFAIVLMVIVYLTYKVLM